jgi:Ca2+-binding EF-hand superfamily protein
MFDANKDGTLEPQEFKALLRHADVIVRDSDLLKVFEIIDLQQTGKISYTDFMNVVDKNVTLPIEQIVRKRRKDRGESYIEDTEAFEADPEEAQRVKAYKTY